MSCQVKRKMKRLDRSIPFKQVRIMDSTQFVVSKRASESFPGYQAKNREAMIQVQFEYELISGKVMELSCAQNHIKETIKRAKELKTKAEFELYEDVTIDGILFEQGTKITIKEMSKVGTDLVNDQIDLLRIVEIEN